VSLFDGVELARQRSSDSERVEIVLFLRSEIAVMRKLFVAAGAVLPREARNSSSVQLPKGLDRAHVFGTSRSMTWRERRNVPKSSSKTSAAAGSQTNSRSARFKGRPSNQNLSSPWDR
jgi:hypothetical protein